MSMNLTKRCTSRILDAKGYVGKNLFDKDKVNKSGYYSYSTGNFVNHATIGSTDFMRVVYNNRYILSGLSDNTNVAFFDSNKQYVSGILTGVVAIVPDDNRIVYMTRAIVHTMDYSLGQIELGSTPTTYSPYSPSALNANALIDRSARRNNGTFSNVSWVKLPSGLWTMDFNGTDSYVEIADSPSMRMTTGGTICAWIKANTIGESEGRIIDKGTDIDSSNGFQIALGPNNTLTAKINAGASLVSSNNAVPFYTWKFVVVTFNSSGRKIYINATDVTASGGSETALPPNVSGVVRIGNRAGATDRTFDGYIALPKIYGKALTQAEIARLFNSQRGFFGV